VKPTILVVDDDEDVRHLLKTTLSDEYNVLEAGDGYYGLSEVVVGDEKVDLIVTDLKMPGSDGIELIQNLPSDIPFIVVSAYLHVPEFSEALDRLEPAAVFRKPFSLAELKEAVESSLSA
jgi:two-component system response regulator HydG